MTTWFYNEHFVFRLAITFIIFRTVIFVSVSEICLAMSDFCVIFKVYVAISENVAFSKLVYQFLNIYVAISEICVIISQFLVTI